MSTNSSQRLDVHLDIVPIRQPIHLVIDSSGLSIVGEGEWAAAKHGGRGKRAWKKLHIGVDRSGVIIAEILTHGSADDAKTALDLIDEVEGDITSITADAAYDTLAIYDAAAAPKPSFRRSRRRRDRGDEDPSPVLAIAQL